jgi:predicted  nucleic acid-binding Zn-ribbon protein
MMMGYRGEDLDLRTPQTWSATPADLAGAMDAAQSTLGGRGGLRSGPIWVDDTVLACANHAFDVALAHRAGEVRLEHLLHALTRIDAAAEALEARGVRVAALRRESATIIASEIPIGLPNGKGAPHRSEELGEVLRLAAANAARRNAPASIEDLLFVLFDQRADLPGLGLLMRNTVRTVVREAIEPMPAVTRYVVEPRYIPAPPQERYVRQPMPEPRVEPRREPRYVQEPIYSPEPPPAYRSEYAGTATDSIQNTRIEALEQMVRALSNDLSSERQVLSGLLKDISRETQAQRDDQGRLHSGLFDRIETLEQTLSHARGPVPGEGLGERLQTIEAGLEARLNDMAKSWNGMSERLKALEAAVRESSAVRGSDPAIIIDRVRQAFDLKPISNRLDIIEEALLSREPDQGGDVADRLKSLEGEIARALAANTASTSRMETLITGFERRGVDLSGPIVERVNALHTAYQGQHAVTTDLASKLMERMSAVERALAGEIETSAAKHQAYAGDLAEVHDALMKLNQNQHTLAGSIDQWRTDAAGDIAVISNRLANLDRDNERPIATLNAMTENMDRMNRLMIEKYHRRNRFWYWLFGTDDWISASWPSQVASIENERQKFKVPAE